jgi:hypothetical protein
MRHASAAGLHAVLLDARVWLCTRVQARPAPQGRSGKHPQASRPVGTSFARGAREFTQAALEAEAYFLWSSGGPWAGFISSARELDCMVALLDNLCNLSATRLPDVQFRVSEQRVADCDRVRILDRLRHNDALALTEGFNRIQAALRVAGVAAPAAAFHPYPRSGGPADPPL